MTIWLIQRRVTRDGADGPYFDFEVDLEHGYYLSGESAQDAADRLNTDLLRQYDRRVADQRAMFDTRAQATAVEAQKAEFLRDNGFDVDIPEVPGPDEFCPQPFDQFAVWQPCYGVEAVPAASPT